MDLFATAERVFANAPRLKIAVVGDFYLDRYIVGNMEAISREAPVPIVRVEHDEYLPGGGGNTTLNVRALGAETYAVGVIGDDLSAEIMVREFERRGVRTEYLLRDPRRLTPTFNKIYASSYHGRKQQVARFDQENAQPVSQEDEARIVEILQARMPEWDAVIVDDYNEVQETGVVTQAILDTVVRVSQEAGVVTVGDSRRRIHRFRHFTALVPNEVELALGLGLAENVHLEGDELDRAALRFLEETRPRYLIVTLAEKGAAIYEWGKKPVRVPTWSIPGEIDVTGAGDTFAAMLSVALASGCDVAGAVNLANAAAAVVVRKLFTTGTASPAEVLAQLSQERL
ncbi:MAG: PfkB family carbohydrate kinase [candidate division KSB1 bacterium]|nr:PfkB family carbohydrate kinase [candidate division KSB1 bacterium]